MTDKIYGYLLDFDDHYEEWIVYECGVYGESSVLGGQAFCRSLLPGYATKELALEAYPTAKEEAPITISRRARVDLTDVVPDWFDPQDAGETW